MNLTPASQDAAKALAQELITNGRVSIRGADGRYLFLMTRRHFGHLNDGIIIALEGGGVMVWKCDRPMNLFRLVSAGFDLTLSATLAPILNEVYECLRPRAPLKIPQIAHRRRKKTSQ